MGRRVESSALVMPAQKLRTSWVGLSCSHLLVLCMRTTNKPQAIRIQESLLHGNGLLVRTDTGACGGAMGLHD